jgi:sensor histidine kinase YesM
MALVVRTRSGHEWRRAALLISAGALLAFLASGQAAAPTWERFWRGLAISAIYATSIGTLATLVIPRLLARFATSRVTWAIHLGGLVVVIAAAIALGTAVLILVGLADPGEYLPPSRWPAFALPTILAVSLGISLYEGLRAELETTRFNLRTKERDEALARQAAAEARLASLQSRVEPHFLFNTLNSIASLIHDDPARAEQMVVQLSSLLRSALDQTPVLLVPLGEELRLVSGYIEIERVRLGPRLRCEISLSEAAGSALVPRLAIQTIAENAVKYAVAARRQGASMAIRATADDGSATIEVTDDGPGFP